MIEPRDATGRTLRAAGELTISLIDPEISTSQGYCGLWNVSVEQASQRLVHTGSGDGIYVEFPLSRPPQHRELTLFVRLTDRNGRRLETHRTLFFQGVTEGT
ncbi:MAG: hypothetical protein Q4C47_02520 [Planctomycetia bacterium]|nr:hypothetical protein [Planctomycetia bacterium]